MAKADRFYYENFVAAAEFSCEGAKYLRSCMENYDYSKIDDMLYAMHHIENSGDKKRHEMQEALAKAFVTPLDREDLAQISHDIDNVTDCIEEILQRFYVDRIEKILPCAVEFADRIVESCDLVKQILVELSNFKKPQKLKELIIELSHKEEECDKLYLKSTHDIPDQTKDVLEIIGWREILSKMEKCADACEHVGDVIETMVMKNT